MLTTPPIELLDTLVTPDPASDTPLHAQVRRAMRRIIDEHFEDGQQFWTEQALVARMSVSQITIRRALNDLAKDGVLVRRTSKGSLVRKPKPALDYRVGIFVPKYNSDILRNLLDHFAQACHDRGHRMQTFFTHKGQRASEAFSALEYTPEQQRVIMLGNPEPLTHGLVEVLANQGYRSVSVEATVPNRATDYVGVDDAEGIRIAMRHLMELGHRHITLLVNEPERAAAVVKRRLMFEQVAAELKLPATVISCGTQYWDNAHDTAYAAMPTVWNQEKRPTAVLTVSDAGAWAALKWFAEQEIPVPDEVSVMGFDNDRLSQFMRPALTTLGRDYGQIADKALEALARQSGEPVELLIPPFLIVRESTGAVRV